MYEKFYGLKERPFQLLPDPSFLFNSKAHSVALTMLRYSLISRQGFTVITGEVGCGKTTLINHLLDEMEEGVTVGLINFTQSAYEDLAEWIMMSYGLDYKGKGKAELYEDFVKFLIKQYAAGKRTVLIIDEAQNMEARGLENVRMLSNVNAQKDYLLHLILVGQPELRTLLQKPELRQLAQRISVAYHISKLSSREVREYVQHRLKVAGGDPGLFAPEALRMVSVASGGIPRVVNTICDLALVYGYAAQKPMIDIGVINGVLEDRDRMGLAGVLPAELDFDAPIDAPPAPAAHVARK
jgi:type II secretory pathway predicted ATPase ExeA